MLTSDPDPSGGERGTTPVAKTARPPALPSKRGARGESTAESEHQANDPDDEPRDRDGERPAGRLPRAVAEAPSWLISAVLHMILLITLALCTLQAARPAVDELVLSSIEPHDEPTEFEIASIDAPPLESMDDASAAMPDAFGAIDLGPIAAEVEIRAETGIAAPSVSRSMTEIGDLLGADGAGFAKPGTGMGGAEFFGVKSTGTRFVFVVDGSNSMGRAGKWDECRRELLLAVRKLSPRQRFYVFLFARRSHRMFGHDEVGNLVRADAENIEKLRKWLYYDYKLQGGTVPIDGLREALTKMNPDAVYLLSDGQFTDNGRSEQYLLDYARTRNDRVMFETGDRYRVAVHTIAFHSRRGEPVLKGIADAFGGTFRFVPGK